MTLCHVCVCVFAYGSGSVSKACPCVELGEEEACEKLEKVHVQEEIVVVSMHTLSEPQESNCPKHTPVQ